MTSPIMIDQRFTARRVRKTALDGRWRWVSALLVGGCAVASQPPTAGPPVGKAPVHAEVGPDGGLDATNAASPSDAIPARFAPSPITELANRVTELALAVLDGKPPPPGMPIGFINPGDRLVEAEAPTPRAADLEVLGFAAHVSLVLREAPPTSLSEAGNRASAAAPEDGSIGATLWLDRRRLRLVRLVMERPAPVVSTPELLRELFASAAELHRSARANELDRWLLDESDRVATEGPLFAQLSTVRPQPEILARAVAAAQKWPLRAIRDESTFFVIARARDGELWQMDSWFGLGWVPAEGGARSGYGFHTNPLLKVSRVRREAH